MDFVMRASGAATRRHLIGVGAPFLCQDFAPHKAQDFAGTYANPWYKNVETTLSRLKSGSGPAALVSTCLIT